MAMAFKLLELPGNILLFGNISVEALFNVNGECEYQNYASHHCAELNKSKLAKGVLDHRSHQIAKDPTNYSQKVPCE